MPTTAKFLPYDAERDLASLMYSLVVGGLSDAVEYVDIGSILAVNIPNMTPIPNPTKIKPRGSGKEFRTNIGYT